MTARFTSGNNETNLYTTTENLGQPAIQISKMQCPAENHKCLKDGG